MTSRVLPLLLLVTAAALAQDRRVPPTSSGPGPRRVALAIGNDLYPGMPLKNAVNDAIAVESALREMGFDVTRVVNGSREAIEKAVETFGGKLGVGDVAFFFYAGHGISLDGTNYLVPVDFHAADAADARYRAVSADWVLEKIQQHGTQLSFLVLDACRNNPYKSARALGTGLAAMKSPAKGSFIAFATSPGETAEDDPMAGNGVFTQHLIEALRQPGLSHDQVFNRVRQRVSEATAGKQLPWSNTSVIGDFVFRPAPGGAAAAAPESADASVSLSADTLLWQTVKDSNDVRMLNEYLGRFPNGTYAGVARLRIEALQKQSPSAPGEATPTDQPPTDQSLEPLLGTWRCTTDFPHEQGHTLLESLLVFTRNRDGYGATLTHSRNVRNIDKKNRERKVTVSPEPPVTVSFRWKQGGWHVDMQAGGNSLPTMSCLHQPTGWHCTLAGMMIPAIWDPGLSELQAVQIGKTTSSVKRACVKED